MYLLIESPPLARGLCATPNYRKQRNRITPACAGTINRNVCIRFLLKNHPRLRGDYAVSYRSLVETMESPPLARGLFASKSLLICQVRITPACAGTIAKNADKYLVLLLIPYFFYYFLADAVLIFFNAS